MSLLAHAPATRVGLIAYTIPIVAVAVGAIAFGERIRARLLAASWWSRVLPWSTAPGREAVRGIPCRPRGMGLS